MHPKIHKIQSIILQNNKLHRLLLDLWRYTEAFLLNLQCPLDLSLTFVRMYLAPPGGRIKVSFHDFMVNMIFQSLDVLYN